MKYIGFMRAAAWIRNSRDADGEHISVTEKGREFVTILSKYIEGDNNIITENALESSVCDSIPKGTNLDKSDIMRVYDTEANKNRNYGNDDINRRANKEIRILLIDDEPDVALTYQSFLMAEGYTVKVFQDPEKALQHFVSMRPDFYNLVITDIRMNRLNGLKLYQRMKTLDPSIKIVFVTALDAADEIVTMLFPEPAGILRKPVDQKNFCKYVESLLS